ncbi:MAG: hypothetical protein PF450_10235, partial [Bacteroidales bacterium]|nr:hypothetical protein [Bacteroidales bacterium]
MEKTVEIKQIDMSYGAWEEKYKPIMDADNNNDSPKDFMDDDVAVAKAIGENRIWTMGFEDGLQWLTSGAKWVNRAEYYITKYPFDGSKSIDVDIYPTEEFRDDMMHSVLGLIPELTEEIMLPKFQSLEAFSIEEYRDTVE